MPLFSYKAVSADGSEISGKSTATSKANAIQALSDAGYAVYDIAEGENTGPVPWYRRELFQAGQLSDIETADLSLTLSAMLERQLPIDEALSIASETASSARVRQNLQKVHDLLIAGEAIDDAFASIDQGFPQEFLFMVKAGAASNALAKTLKDAASYFTRRANVRQSVLAAAAYPLFLILAAIIVFGIILFMLIPSLHETMASTRGGATGTVASMHRLSVWLISNWAGLLAGIIALVGALIFFRKQVGGALSWAVPPIQRHDATFFYARAARIIGILLVSGERLDDALAKTNELLSRTRFSEPLDDAFDAFRRGELAGAHFLKDERVPALFARFFDLGERTNNLPSLLLLAADSLEMSHAATLKKMTSLLTPVLTLIVGGIIALVVQVLISAVLEVSQVAI